jgi:hypothetical protein
VILWSPSLNFTALKAGIEHGFGPLAFNSVRRLIAAVLLCASPAVSRSTLISSSGSLRLRVR